MNAGYRDKIEFMSWKTLITFTCSLNSTITNFSKVYDMSWVSLASINNKKITNKIDKKIPNEIFANVTKETSLIFLGTKWWNIQKKIFCQSFLKQTKREKKKNENKMANAKLLCYMQTQLTTIHILITLI